MTAPATDPVILQVLNALAIALARISQANGFYNDVAGAGIEPLAFDAGDSYPQIVVQEESGQITDSNAKGYADQVVVAIHGFIPTQSSTAYATAMRLRDDITRAARSVTAATFIDINGRQLLGGLAVQGARQIVPADAAEGFLEVIVHVSLDYRDFIPPATGIQP